MANPRPDPTRAPQLFLRQYRAALLDYLLGSGEGGLTRAYELGRQAVDEGLGLLALLRTHQRAINVVLESTPDAARRFRRVQASEEFLMETLSPFEMTYRGYVALLAGHDERRPRGAASSHHTRHRPR